MASILCLDDQPTNLDLLRSILALGATGFIRRPIEPEELLAEIEAYLPARKGG